MAYDEAVADRLRDALVTLADPGELREQKMFGGLALLVRNHLCCGVVGADAIVRVGPAAYDAALARPGTRPFDFTGRPSRGIVYVTASGLTDDDVSAWVARAVAFVATLPPKVTAPPRRRRAPTAR